MRTYSPVGVMLAQNENGNHIISNINNYQNRLNTNDTESIITINRNQSIETETNNFNNLLATTFNEENWENFGTLNFECNHQLIEPDNELTVVRNQTNLNNRQKTIGPVTLKDNNNTTTIPKTFIQVECINTKNSLAERRENLPKFDFTLNHQRRNFNQLRPQNTSFLGIESSPDDSLMEEEDVYSPAPSTYASYNSPEPSFPRGIINPNYPGFQHLAHTLSEHFIDHHQTTGEQYSDSDFSELDTDLGSIEEFYRTTETNNNTIQDVTINKSNTFCINNNSITNVGTPSSPINGNETEIVANVSFVPEIKISDVVIDEKSQIAINYGDKFNKIVKDDLSIGTADMATDRKKTMKMKNYKRDDENLSIESDELVEMKSQTPDILVKDGKLEMKPLKCDSICANQQPDLLQNLCRQEANKLNLDVTIKSVPVDKTIKGNDNDDAIESHRSAKLVHENDGKLLATVNNKNITIDPDEGNTTQWQSITPVDIIGDFGDEVEREIGLIVSSYKDGENTYTDSLKPISPTASIELTHQPPIDKMTDAVLSTSVEELTFSTLVSVTDDRSFSNSLCSEVRPIERELPPLNRCTNEVKPVKFSLENQKITTIPTASIKPRYQRTSYDERVLPAVINSVSNTNWLHHTKPFNHQQLKLRSPIDTNRTEYDRIPFDSIKRISANKHKKNLKHIHYNVNNFVSDKEKINILRHYEKDIDTVAIVPPRQKQHCTINMTENRTSTSDLKLVTDVKRPADQIYNTSYQFDNNNQKSIGMCNNNELSAFNLNGNNRIYSGNTGDRKYSSVGGNSRCEKTGTSGRDTLGSSFDVYNIETALPVIDLEAIENHLKAAKEAERRKRNDREEIRRRLAMDAEDDYFNKVVSDKPGRKPSLQSRLQSGMNLQICFMNETASDNESPSSDSESCPKLSKGVPHNRSTLYTTSASLRNGANNTSNPYTSKPLSSRVERTFDARPKSLAFAPQTIRISDEIQSDFFTKQAKLQIEARMALAQAKDMAHMQMEIDRQKLKESPITTMIRNALQKAGVKFPKEKRRVSRQLLTDMNVAQLQIIVNEMHTQIERLNEQLVQFLMERDELHMGQDSMLVDIEDLTRYLTAKEANEDVNDDNVPFKNPNRNIIGSTTTVNNRIESVKLQKQIAGNQTMQTQSSSQNKLLRIASLVKK